MRLPIFPVLGAFLSVAIFGPFVLMLAGVALTGDPDAAQVGLFLLLKVNPVAIPSLLLMLAIAWAIRRWATPPIPSKSDAASMPRAPSPSCRPAVASSARRSARDRDWVIDVAAVEAGVRPVQRASTVGARCAVSCHTPTLRLEVAKATQLKALGLTAR